MSATLAVISAVVAVVGLLAGAMGWVNGTIAKALTQHREVSDQVYARLADLARLEARMDAQKDILEDIQAMVRELQKESK